MILQGADDATRQKFSETLAGLVGWPSGEGNGELVSLLDSILSTVSNPDFPGAVVPIIAGPKLSFYALADDGAQWRALRPLLQAAIGATLSSFDGQTITDLSEEGVQGLFASHNLVVAKTETRATTGDPEAKKLARNLNGRAVRALVTLITQVSNLPDGSTTRMQSTAQLLHEFDLAVEAGDEDAASRALAQLERQRSIDVLNLRFLQTRIDSAFGHWARLRNRNWFGDLCRTRRPPAVTTALVEALCRTELADSLNEEPQTLLEAFEERVRPYAGRLFDTLLPRPSTMVATAFLLHALSTRDRERLETLNLLPVSDWTKERGRLLDGLSELVTAIQTAQAPLAGGTDALMGHALEVVDAETTLAILIQHLDTGTLEGERVAQELHGHLSTLDFSEQRIARFGVEIPPHRVPETWVDWFESLPTLDYETARDIAVKAISEWPVDQQLRSTSDIRAFVNALDEALSGESQSRSLAAIPHLVEWLRSDPAWPNPILQSLYSGVLTALLVVDVQSANVVRGALHLVDGLLTIGMGRTEYRHLLDDLQESLQAVTSAGTLDLLLDVVESTTLHPCPDESRRFEFWVRISNYIAPYSRRLLTRHRRLIEYLNAVLGSAGSIDLPVNEKPPNPTAARTWRGRIGIYTLREEVGRRAREILSEIYPLARIDARGDKVSSAELRNMAARSDILVVAWSAAKHAATDAVRDARGDRPILWASGGASSIVAVVQDSEMEFVQEVAT